MYVISNNSLKFKEILIQNKIFFSKVVLDKLLNSNLKSQSEKLYYNLYEKKIMINGVNIQNKIYYFLTFGDKNILSSKLKKVHIYYDKNISKYGKIKCNYLLNSNKIKKNINVCFGNYNIKANSKNIVILNISNISEIRSIDVGTLDSNNLYIFSLFDICTSLSIADVLVITEAKYEEYPIKLVDTFLNKGKDILVMPGDIWNKNCYFSNFLIHEGAGILLNIDDLNMYL